MYHQDLMVKGIMDDRMREAEAVRRGYAARRRRARGRLAGRRSRGADA